MDPTTPAHPASAMSHGGTFMRPGVIGWAPRTPRTPPPEGEPRIPANPCDQATPGTIEHALAAAVKDPDRVTDLLDELSRGRLWLPLPDDRPVTDGSAVLLPTVTYLGEEFVPAFASARRLARWLGRTDTSAAMPHIVVPAAELARRLPPGVGIALNPGAEASVPIYPEGVGYLAAAIVISDGAQLRVGRPPADPVILLSEVRAVLASIPAVRQASSAWLSVPGRGEGLVIPVTLHDPACRTVQDQVVNAIKQAVGAVSEQGFPIDVTFPGEAEPDQLGERISAHAEPFYVRG